MLELLWLLLAILVASIRPRQDLVLENLLLHHRLAVLTLPTRSRPRARLREITGKLRVVWDGAPIHRAQVVKDFSAQGAATRLHREPLPAYAPELNPAAGLRHTLKCVELRNVCCRDLADLRAQVRLATARLRHTPARLRGYVRHWTDCAVAR